MTAALQCEDLTVGYDGAPVLSGFDLSVAADEVVAVLGPSGSGKSTLLHAIAGFVQPDRGAIRIGGRVVAGRGCLVAPHERDVALVFQHNALWPHLSALQTVAYPLRRRGVSRQVARQEAASLLERVGLSELAQRRPADLSGGEQQRVGLARALARAASLYLFDEPTAALDAPLRAVLQSEIAARRRDTGAAALYSTHDSAEALAVADRVGLLRDGQLVQLDTPTRVYSEPVDLWAARLTGPASLLTRRAQTREPGMVTLRADDGDIRVPAGGTTREPAAMLIRPDWTSLGGPLAGAVTAVAYRGPHTDYRLSSPFGDVEVRHPGPPQARVAERVAWAIHRVWWVAVDPLE